MTAPRTGHGVVGLAEAEVCILRATAVRSLMATGATHHEAAAVVDEQLRHELARDLVHLYAMLAGIEDAAEWLARHVWPRLAAAFIEAGRQLAPVLKQVAEHAPVAPGHRVPDDDRFAALLERKRAGLGSGPAAPRMDGRRAA